MTPLAHSIVRELTLPVNRRTLDDRASLLPALRNEFHTFDVTEMLSEMVALGVAFIDDSMPSVEWSFLPADQTWIEWLDGDRRVGFLLQQDGDFARVTATIGRSTAYLGKMALEPHLERCATDAEATQLIYAPDCGLSDVVVQAVFFKLWAALCLINTPQVVGRRVHAPHRGMQRRLVAALGLQGSFPLQAWTEIVLTPLRPHDASGEAPAVGGLTGRVCLHWVRAHKRRIHGIRTRIGGFWRGDGSLGIRRSRYKLAA